jgi:cysteinyl-tRNA synthetase
MKIYNTLTRTVEEFKPLNGQKVNFFVCGPTVYDFAHIGNAKTYTQFDFIVKYLRLRGYDVFYLQNITDLDDKIIKRAAEKNISWKTLSKEYEDIYYEDMKSLGNSAVSEYAAATNYISEIVKQVQVLMEKGYAYKAGDGIYYDISKFSDYGKLSKRTEADRDAGVSRIDEGSDKKNKNDFCLWKFSKEGEPSWETEIGNGRPGWHIEDTAITEKFFGPQYDVHGAAVDLIFPHHEAEIAQMEAASGKAPLAKYWMHAAFLNIGSEKMSKSRGNFMTAREGVEKYGYRLLRFFFISNHYRTALDFNETVMEQVRGGLRRIDEFTLAIDPNRDDDAVAAKKLQAEIYESLDNDFDTPKAFASIFNFIRQSNLNGGGGKNAEAVFRDLDKMFGFLKFEETEEVTAEVEKLLIKRNRLRGEKEFDKADRVREEIERLGFVIEDTGVESKLRKA